MKRAASQNASAADSRRAADRLRQATDALGGAQQQDAASRLKSMAQNADELAARQKQQADHVRDLIAQQNAPRAPGQAAPRGPSAQEIDKMVNDRQQVSDDLSHLTQRLRDAARELAPTQPAATGKLRSALEGMDQNDLGSRVQNSSDLLRRGQFSDPLETGLTSDLKKLSQQVDDAARALGSAERPSEDAKLNRAMDDLAKLRDQINNLGGQGRDRTAAGTTTASRARADKTGNARPMRSPATGSKVKVSKARQQGQGNRAKASKDKANRVSSRHKTARAVRTARPADVRAARSATASPVSSGRAVAGPTTRAIAGL